MTESGTGQAITAATVRESAAVLGLPLEDEATAARIAAGADAAVAAVRTALAKVDDAASLFDREPAEYLALLEALADPPADAAT